jgi:hypothetical protein
MQPVRVRSTAGTFIWDTAGTFIWDKAGTFIWDTASTGPFFTINFPVSQAKAVLNHYRKIPFNLTTHSHPK